MWRPPINFVTLHYAYIILLGIFGFIAIYPYGNLKAIDAYFFGASATTESGLNTIDVKELATYQQLTIYFLPIITNLGFINIVVVVVRLYWFEKHLKRIAPSVLRKTSSRRNATNDDDVEDQVNRASGRLITEHSTAQSSTVVDGSTRSRIGEKASDAASPAKAGDDEKAATKDVSGKPEEEAVTTSNAVSGTTPHIAFAEGTLGSPKKKALRIPSPREREKGLPLEEVNESDEDEDPDKISRVNSNDAGPSGLYRRRTGPAALEKVASAMFTVGPSPSRDRTMTRSESMSQASATLPNLSSQASIGRNSQFFNLTAQDREQLGGMEYRALKLLLKIVTGYFFGLHLFGAICLAGWIQTANPKYRDYLDECGQDKTWWGFYTSQTMISNLGFTLTPDSMVSFQDATFPLLVMSFLAFAGNTLYPCFLRWIIWGISFVLPTTSSLQEPLRFLLDHPRRCYTLLFPAKPTWILFGIIFALNFIDTLLIVVLDLHNSAVNNLAPGPRVLAALFQAASSRHTGTASFNLADVHPAVQFSLLVMMYISVFPIAIAVRSSNTYEERSLGMYARDEETFDEDNSSAYLVRHLQNQLSFDLWYIFLGIFCITIAESKRIMDDADPAFAVFPIFFEVTSAYANVGLSLGYPTVATSLCGQFTLFSKLVICAMMIRGRHRGLPYALDHAIVLPSENFIRREVTREREDVEHEEKMDRIEGEKKFKRYNTR